jgi:hypothetical protein
MILQPTVEPRPKQEVDEGIEVRPVKRRKSTPPPENNKSTSPEKSVNGSKDERKKKWLAGLSHEELLGGSSRCGLAKYVTWITSSCCAEESKLIEWSW